MHFNGAATTGTVTKLSGKVNHVFICRTVLCHKLYQV